MDEYRFARSAFFTLLLVLLLEQNLPAQSEDQPRGRKTSAEDSMSLEAKLVDTEKKAQEQAATVEVTAKGIQLVDPAKVNEEPKKGQGHLHYKLDDGPVIATTSSKLSFHELSPGEHKLVVQLAANDHKPLGPEETLKVKVPEKGGSPQTRRGK